MARSTLLGIAGGEHSFHLSTRPSLSSWGSRTYWPIGSPITQPAGKNHALGHGEAGAAQACRCPVRGTSGPRCIRAGRNYPAGLPSYQEPM
eukprot:scaffold49629_cov70-Phaeocystis_antarctica.AAC.1